MPPLWLGPFCQISNLAGSPLAHAFRHISGTFYLFPAQLVATLQSRPLARSFHLGFDPFPQFPTQLVVHSPKWSTSSRLSPQFQHFYPVPYPASGPLQRVDHWLAAFASVLPFFLSFHPSQWSTLKSGPLAQGFCLVCHLSPIPKSPCPQDRGYTI